MTHQDGGVERKAAGHPDGGAAGKGRKRKSAAVASDGVQRNEVGQYLPGTAAPDGVGAPPDNANATKTGVRVNPRRLVVGRLPAKYVHAERTGREYRRLLEDATIAAKGEVSLQDAHWIDAATGHELHKLILLQILRDGTSKLTPVDVVRISESIAKAREARNRCYERLELNKPKEEDPLAFLYGPPLQEPVDGVGREMGDGAAGETDPPANAREASPEKRREEDRP